MNNKSHIIASTLAAFSLLIILWQILIVAYNIPDYLVPSPIRIGQEIAASWNYLLLHTYSTFCEVVLGYIPSLFLAFILGALITESSLFSKLVYPPLVVSQVIPKIALAPILIVWFGYGFVPKAIITALIAFFPILSNTILGLTNVDSKNPEYINLMKTLGASRWEIFFKVRVPDSIPIIIPAAKVSALYSVVGAITAEFVGAKSGIGYIIMVSESNLNVPLMFAGLVFASFLGMLMWLIITFAGNIALRIRQS